MANCIYKYKGKDYTKDEFYSLVRTTMVQPKTVQKYEKVLFPTGNTASKVEGHTTLEEFKKQKEDRINTLTKKIDFKKWVKAHNENNYVELVKDFKEETGNTDWTEAKVKIQVDNVVIEVSQLKQELKDIEGPEGFGALRKIWGFYENTVSNVLKKQGYNPVKITDEYGNTWNEVSIIPELALDTIMFNKDLNLEDTTEEYITEVLNKLSKQLGVDYQVVTEQEAAELTKNATAKWNGEKAFFLGGKVYFVGNKMTLKDAFHEFAHPFLRALQVQNKPLFDSLFQKLVSSEEGISIIEYVREMYPELQDSPELFQEECLAFALQRSTESTFMDSASSPFKKLIDDILFAIKQLLRKVFGRTIDISKLDPNTPLDKLASILIKGGQFQIDSQLITQENVASYIKERKAFIEDVAKISNPDLIRIATEGFKIAQKEVNDILRNKNYSKMLNIWADEYNRGDLQEIKNNLSKYTAQLTERTEELNEDLKVTESRVEAIVNSLFRIEKMTLKMFGHIQDLENTATEKELLRHAFYYNKLLNDWLRFIQTGEATAAEYDISPSSPLLKLMGSIKNAIDRSKEKLDLFRRLGISEELYSTLEPLKEAINSRFIEKERGARQKNASKKIINEIYLEYYGLTPESYNRFQELERMNKLGNLSYDDKLVYKSLLSQSFKGNRITKEKIDAMLRGDAGDANQFNSFLEGYLYNDDPVIGGFALYVKKNLDEIMVKVQAAQNDFLRDVMPKVNEAGYSPTDPGDLGKRIGFLDSIGGEDEDGNFKTVQVWTLLNRFKDYRAAIEQMDWNIDKAQEEYKRSGKEEDREKIVNLIHDKKKHLREFFHQIYVDEFYQRQELFEQDEIGIKAAELRNDIFDRMRSITEKQSSEMDSITIANELEEVWRDYRLLHSYMDLDGNLKTGEDLEIAKRLNEYRDRSSKYYESHLVKGLYENSLANLEQELLDRGLDPKLIESLKQAWINKNTRTVIKPEFYERRNQIFKRISELTSTLPDAERKKIDFSEAWGVILDAVAGFRDQDGQPDATKMSKGRVDRVREQQLYIMESMNNWTTLSGLTKNEMSELSMLFELAKEQGLDPSERFRLNQLLEKKQIFGLSKAQKAELNSLFTELKELQSKEATDYYVDIANNWLSKLDTSYLESKTGLTRVDKDTADFLLDNDVITNLSKQSPEFKKWFEANHIKKEFYNQETQSDDYSWERLYIWNIIKPNDPDYIEKLPAMKFYTRRVKNEYKTGYNPQTKKVELQVGYHVDNRGNFLPKLNARDDRYINRAYDDLQRNDPKLFNALEAIKEKHLSYQAEMPYSSRLYMDFPRFRKNDLEALRTFDAEKKWNLVTLLVKRVRDFFKGGADDAENNLGYKEDNNLLRLDNLDEENTSVPIAGLYALDLEDTSTDIMYSIMRYMSSGKKQAKLLEISPAAQALKAVLNNPSNKPASAGSKYVRQDAINNFVEKIFNGKVNTGVGANNAAVNNIASKMFGLASKSFFAINIPSALKNALGAKFQGLVESASGKYFNFKDFLLAEQWSFNAMMKISTEIYSRAPKSIDVQLVELFDPTEGRFDQKLGESTSRTLAGDTVNLSWLYNFRKWTELQSSLQMFSAMMKNQKVKRGTKEIDYQDAWEIKDGKIQLKPGIDPEWGITYTPEGEIKIGKKFQNKRLQIQAVTRDLQGAFDNFNQPEAQRYLYFRFLSYLRRYFTTMFINRFGFKGNILDPKARLNVGKSEQSMGFYITALKSIKDMATTNKIKALYFTKEEAQAWSRIGLDSMMLFFLQLIITSLFDWDDTDPDRYKKLREKTSPLPFPFVPEEEVPFDATEWYKIHALGLLMQIKSENSQFIPLPGLGLDDYNNLASATSAVLGPTFSTYVDLTADVYHMSGLGNPDKVYYKRDVGPYEWQQQGGSKFWAHLMKTQGFTGSTLDPITAIKNFESIQARAKGN